MVEWQRSRHGNEYCDSAFSYVRPEWERLIVGHWHFHHQLEATVLNAWRREDGIVHSFVDPVPSVPSAISVSVPAFIVLPSLPQLKSLQDRIVSIMAGSPKKAALLLIVTDDIYNSVGGRKILKRWASLAQEPYLSTLPSTFSYQFNPPVPAPDVPAPATPSPPDHSCMFQSWMGEHVDTSPAITSRSPWIDPDDPAVVSALEYSRRLSSGTGNSRDSLPGHGGHSL
eukprot:gene8887-biopygen7008